MRRKGKKKREKGLHFTCLDRVTKGNENEIKRMREIADPFIILLYFLQILGELRGKQSF